MEFDKQKDVEDVVEKIIECLVEVRNDTDEYIKHFQAELRRLRNDEPFVRKDRQKEIF